MRELRRQFFDLNRNPITCPKCGTIFQAASPARAQRAAAANDDDEAETDPVAADVVSLEEADDTDAKVAAVAVPDEDIDLGDDDAATIPSSRKKRKRTTTSPASSTATSKRTTKTDLWSVCAHLLKKRCRASVIGLESGGFSGYTPARSVKRTANAPKAFACIALQLREMGP